MLDHQHPWNEYKTIIFDAGGTLVGFNDPAPFQRFLAEFSAEQRYASTKQNALGLMKRIESEHRRMQDAAYQQNRAPDVTGHFWYSVFFKIWSGSESIADAMFDWFLRGEFDTLYDDVRPTLEMLSTKSIQMGILSNFAPTLEDRLCELGIHSYFDFFVVSSVVGLTKPDPAIFDLAVSRAACPREYILYVGDNLEIDIEGARQAKVSAIFIDRENRYVTASCARIHSLMEIEKFVVGSTRVA